LEGIAKVGATGRSPLRTRLEKGCLPPYGRLPVPVCWQAGADRGQAGSEGVKGEDRCLLRPPHLEEIDMDP